MNHAAYGFAPAPDSQKIFEEASALHKAGKFKEAEAILRDGGKQNDRRDQR
jgi:hypothetical protein